MEHKTYFFFVVNFDWRNLFKDGRDELYKKLQRDGLKPETNSFFFFSWARTSYESTEGTWRTKHQKTYGVEKLRPLLNMWALALIPYTTYKRALRPHAWLVYDFGMVPAVWIASRLLGGELIMIVNNQATQCSGTRKYRLVRKAYAWLAERIGVRFVDHFFTINSSMVNYLKRLGVSEEDVSIYTVNTIERDRAYIEKVQQGYARKKLGIGNKKVILTVGRLEAEKNHEALLTLFSSLPDEYVLVCLGEGSLRTQLERKAQTLGVQDSLFFEGNVERDEIWNYYADADAFVLLSKAEALGIVFWEAMYMGVPVIGSSVPGIEESLGTSGERGLILEEEDSAEGFISKVSFCVTPSKERDTMTYNAEVYVEEKLTQGTTVNEYLKNLERKQ